MTPEEYIQRLTEISNKKYKLLLEMLSITRDQAASLNEEDVGKLEGHIDAKQARIGEIDRLDEQFNVYFLRLKQELKIGSLEELKASQVNGAREFRDVIGSVMAVIEEISALEKSNNDRGKGLLNQFGQEVKKASQTRKVNQAYNPAPTGQPPSYFIDKKK